MLQTFAISHSVCRRSSSHLTNDPREDAMRLKGFLAAGLCAASLALMGHGINAQNKPKFYVNFIGGPEIQFFAVVKRGVEEAGKDLGVEAIYSAPKCCDINLQAQLLKS